MNEDKNLLLQKDLIEVQYWQTKLEENHKELDYLLVIHKQILKTADIAYALQQIRREHTLMMAGICKYEQKLKNALRESYYDFALNKAHEKKRVEFQNSDQKFFELKLNLYKKLSQFTVVK